MTSNLARVLKRMIERGNTEGISEKIDMFYATNKISEEDYDALQIMINPKKPE